LRIFGIPEKTCSLVTLLRSQADGMAFRVGGGWRERTAAKGFEALAFSRMGFMWR
jgi:hypothetical protein